LVIALSYRHGSLLRDALFFYFHDFGNLTLNGGLTGSVGNTGHHYHHRRGDREEGLRAGASATPLPARQERPTIPRRRAA